MSERCSIVASENGNLVFAELLNPHPMVIGPYANVGPHSPAINEERRVSGIVFDKEWEVQRYLFSIQKRTRFWWNCCGSSVTMELTLVVIPYISIVIPLAAFSGYLLLFTPRPAKKPAVIPNLTEAV